MHAHNHKVPTPMAWLMVDSFRSESYVFDDKTTVVLVRTLVVTKTNLMRSSRQGLNAVPITSNLEPWLGNDDSWRAAEQYGIRKMMTGSTSL
jgi:hypothetical protein